MTLPRPLCARIRRCRPGTFDILPLKDFQRPGIGFPGKVLIQCVFEDTVIRCDGGEQGHARAEFQIVGRAEDGVRGAAAERIDELRAFTQPGTKSRMFEVGRRFVPTGDRMALSHGAVPQAADLREDEPHPMARLPAPAQFVQHTRIHALLGLDEPLQVERVGHGGSCMRQNQCNSIWHV